MKPLSFRCLHAPCVFLLAFASSQAQLKGESYADPGPAHAGGKRLDFVVELPFDGDQSRLENRPAAVREADGPSLPVQVSSADERQREPVPAVAKGIVNSEIKANPNQSGGRDRKSGHGSTVFRTDVPSHSLDLVLGRPSRNTITLSVLAYQDLEGFVAYGIEKGRYSNETPKRLFPKGLPVEVTIDSLQPNSRYYYQFRSRTPNSESFQSGDENTFHTARAVNEGFAFVVQADPHLDENTIPERYHRSMLNMLSDRPDFLIDLGDTFMTGKYRDNRTAAEKHYLAQRYYFGVLGQSAPVFLVLGNHDGEGSKGRRTDAGENGAGVWANAARKKYFPNPVPDDFYTGNAVPHPVAGLLQDYYAWEWGNALFVALDPYWFSAGEARDADDNWSRSLGRAQYDWLKRTLEGSQATFKFVFIHHLVGGATPEGRGGAEAAELYEWGGNNKDGTAGFENHRPGWPEPIHKLLVKYGVTVVFHGHDHMFAKQERDGIIYQCVPQPGNRGDGSAPRNAVEYSYLQGDILGSPGYMRISVSADQMRADLVRTYLPLDESETQKNHQVDYSYAVSARRAGHSMNQPAK